jgi:hypothetical protein
MNTHRRDFLRKMSSVAHRGPFSKRTQNQPRFILHISPECTATGSLVHCAINSRC